MHIWRKKEIENYLLIPSAIYRTIAARTAAAEPEVSPETIRQKLFELAGEMKDEVLDALSSELYAENKAGGPTQANKGARERVGCLWNTPEGRFSLVSGKRLLGRLSEWTQATFGVTINPMRIARELRTEEIAAEVASVLTAIENNEPFEVPRQVSTSGP